MIPFKRSELPTRWLAGAIMRGDSPGAPCSPFPFIQIHFYERYG